MASMVALSGRDAGSTGDASGVSLYRAWRRNFLPTGTYLAKYLPYLPKHVLGKICRRLAGGSHAVQRPRPHRCRLQPTSTETCPKA